MSRVKSCVVVFLATPQRGSVLNDTVRADMVGVETRLELDSPGRRRASRALCGATAGRRRAALPLGGLKRS